MNPIPRSAEKVWNAVVQALETPDVEVRLTFGTAEEAIFFKRAVLARLVDSPVFDPLGGFERGTSPRSTLEIRNGSALTFLVVTE